MNRKTGLKLSRQIILIFVVWMIAVILIITGLVQRTVIYLSEQNAFVYLEQQEISFYFSGEKNYVNEDNLTFFEKPGLIFDNNQAVNIVDPDNEINDVVETSFVTAILDGTVGQEKGKFQFDGNVFYFYRFQNEQGTWISFLNQRDIIRASNEVVIQLLVPILFISVAGLIGAAFWVRYIVRPLREMEEQVQKISRRDWGDELDIQRDDEVGQLAESIDQMRLQLIEQDETQQRMLQHISHDLKTPISIISACAESIQDGVYPYGSLEETADVILKQSARLNEKVQDLLYVTQLEYMLTQDNQSFQHIDIAPILEDVAMHMVHRFPDFEWEIDIHSAEFYGDEESWRIVFENIIENEVRYTHGKMIVRVKDNVICLANDGDPIAQDVVDNIYKPYVKDKKGNFGLGMTIVSRTMQLFNCKIEITNGDVVTFKISNLVDMPEEQ